MSMSVYMRKYTAICVWAQRLVCGDICVDINVHKDMWENSTFTTYKSGLQVTIGKCEYPNTNNFDFVSC